MPSHTLGTRESRYPYIGLLLVIYAMTLTPGNYELIAQPQANHGLHYLEPAMVWDEAMPLGNGLIGALLWGDGRPVNISLDRTDLWDLRPTPEFHSDEYSYRKMREWVNDGRTEDLKRLYEDPYSFYPGPTKIPAGRIELSLGDQSTFRDARLDLAAAVAAMDFTNGTSVEVFVHAEQPVGVIRVAGTDVSPRLVVPGFDEHVESDERLHYNDMKLGNLGYPPPERSDGDGWSGYVQQGWGDFTFAVVLAWKEVGNNWFGVWSIATNGESGDPLATARKRCEEVLETGFDDARVAHQGWWDDFWSKSAVRLPDPVLERLWYTETYKFGAAARQDAPPITLQGPWTADNGKIPPWKGDYHHDLNTQLSYWPSYSGNHLDGESGFLEWLWETKPNAEAWTRRFFELPGLNLPMTADLNNEQIGGWHPYTHSATTGAWLAHHFYLHWRYSLDRRFLRERAWPWLSETAVFLEAITEIDNDGVRHLPLSSSPEINDNRLAAWFDGTSNYDLALIRWTFDKTAELADELDKEQEANHWRAVLDELPEFALSEENGKLLVAPDYPLAESHRHFSHLMAIHPLGQIIWEDGLESRKTITASLEDLDRLGSGLWTGYSFSWLGNMRARARDGAGAAEALRIFAEAFCLRSGFHVNGDQSGKGYSTFTYRPFTLEGNFAASAGVQEMLIQSYSGRIVLFPAIPEEWKNVSFETLRAEGAFLVSAEQRQGIVDRVEIYAEKGGVCRMEDPFVGREFVVSGIPGTRVGRTPGEIVLQLGAGDRVVVRTR